MDFVALLMGFGIRSIGGGLREKGNGKVWVAMGPLRVGAVSLDYQIKQSPYISGFLQLVRDAFRILLQP